MLKVNIRYIDKNVPHMVQAAHGNWIDVRACHIQGQEWTEEDGKKIFRYKAGDFFLVGLGFALQCPNGYEAYIAPRSGTFKNFSVIQTNAWGIVDEAYRGNNDEWFEPFFALRDGEIHQYDRVGEMRFMASMGKVEFVTMEEFPDAVDRGGHGSTGVK